MPRLRTLLLSNNRIQRVDAATAKQLPNLNSLVLTNNQIAELGDLDALGDFSRLEYLSLVDNPVVTKKHYREYVLHRCPKVRVLDFRRVKDKVRGAGRSEEIFCVSVDTRETNMVKPFR